MAAVISVAITRRALLAASAGALACGTKKATGYPGYAFIANRDSRSVAVVDLTRFKVWKQVRLDAAPSAVLAHPAKPRVYALAPQAGTVYEIDGPSLAVSRTARTGGEALAMQFSPDGRSLWVASRQPAEAVELPLDSFRVQRRIRLAAPPDSFDINRDGKAAFAFRAGGIAVANLAASSIERTIPTLAEPSIVRFQGDGRQLLAGSTADSSITIFDTASGRTVVRLPIPVVPRNFCFTLDGGQLFVTGEGVDGVVVVYPYDTEVAETVLAGNAPGCMAVTEAPAYLMVANPKANRVTVLDVETRKLVAVLNVGAEPCRILVTPDKQYALVLNQLSGDLAVVRIPTLAARRYKSAPLFTMIQVGEGPVDATVLPIA